MPILLPIILSGLCVYLVYPSQQWSAKRVIALIGALLWGSLAFGMALTLQNTFVIISGMAINDIRLGIAPALEECLKASLLLLPLVRSRLSSPASGLLYGFTIGMGFALVESLYFANLNPELALTISVTRVFSTNLMHAAGTALIGMALAARQWRIAALMLAVTLHSLFNALNLHLAGDLRLLVLVGLGVCCAFLIQYLMNQRQQPIIIYAD